MEDNNLTIINEVKYLTQENTYRYRLIMKYLFTKYEETMYWLYKEEIYNEVKKVVKEYTLEECERDLEFLLTNGSITKLQDTQNINSINDFKYHNFRYQITDKAVLIERMTIELEEIEVKVASLEPRLFDRITNLLKRLSNIYILDEKQIYEIWVDLNNDFKNLNEQYQDFLKKFYEAKTEELLKSEVFLEFKSSVINYINDFINSYINSSTIIKKLLKEIDEDKTNYLMDVLITHQKRTPKVSLKFDYDKLRKVNYGKLESIKKWFISDIGMSEGERLLEATQSVIDKIYKYANSLIELHGNMINRKEEYKKVCKLFDEIDKKDVNKLSLVIFGYTKTNHFKINPSVETDTLINSYDIEPLEVTIEVMNKEYKTNKSRSAISDKSDRKRELLKQKQQEETERKSKIYELIKNGHVNLTNSVNLDIEERRYILDLIEKYNPPLTKESEFGYTYTISDISNDKCLILSPDGRFELNSRIITFDEVSK